MCPLSLLETFVTDFFYIILSSSLRIQETKNTISSTQFIHLCELVGIQTYFEFYYESSSGIFKKVYVKSIIDYLRYWEIFLRYYGRIL